MNKLKKIKKLEDKIFDLNINIAYIEKTKEKYNKEIETLKQELRIDQVSAEEILLRR
jgi:chaperonin cofactor prefoldin